MASSMSLPHQSFFRRQVLIDAVVIEEDDCFQANANPGPP
jgi:hypothetical protein